MSPLRSPLPLLAALACSLLAGCEASVSTSPADAVAGVAGFDAASPYEGDGEGPSAGDAPGGQGGGATAGAGGSAGGPGQGGGCPLLAQSGPELLPVGRTYDQDTQFFAWEGPVSFVVLEHRDGTSMPADEGGASCGQECAEQVTRIDDGGALLGRFRDIATWSFQAAFEDDDGVGSVVLEVCGQEVQTFAMRGGKGLAGFVNLPQPAWVAPDAGAYTFALRAKGGHVHVRAVTVTGPEPPPSGGPQ